MPNEAGSHPSRKPLQSTLDEHHECLQVVKQLEDALEGPKDPPGPWRTAVLAQLGALRSSLVEHFELESDSALYRELPLKRPQVAVQIDRLAGEHDSMLAALDELTRIGGDTQGPVEAHVRRLIGGTQVLISTIRRHEAEENEIIMNAYWTEIGVGD